VSDLKYLLKAAQEETKMSLVVYNSLSRKKEEFIPLEAGKVRMYCCGPTVYGLLHVGNFRGAIFYNLVRNWLEQIGYQVTYVYNFTDVDDKIIDRAQQEKVSCTEISEKYIAEFKKDFGALKLRAHTVNPKVTQYMDSIKDFVSELVKKDHAYEVEGEVLYSIKSFPEYGKLSGRNPDDMIAGSRVEVDRKKRDPLDFALWKPSKPGEPFWESPWGPGRPGWHIECSAMARSILGDQIDIHGGGMDLLFPHHENELAQSEACTGHHFVKYWMHNNMFNFGGQKMSKSLGNILTGRDFMEKYNPEILKYITLSAHYRSVAEFGETAIELSIKGLARVYSALALADSFLTESSSAATPSVAPAVDAAFEKLTLEAWNGIVTALNDDFNTPEVFARIFEVVRAYNNKVKRGLKATPAVIGLSQQFKNFVHKSGLMMSLFQENALEYLTTLDNMLLEKLALNRADIEKIISERTQVRAAKDFKKSDELRDQLLAMGISVSDTPSGTFWEVTK
jgi:cysteinyl-tRNA synthetase